MAVRQVGQFLGGQSEANSAGGFWLGGMKGEAKEANQLKNPFLRCLLTRPLQASLEHFVVGPLSGGSRRFTSAKKMEGGGKI